MARLSDEGEPFAVFLELRRVRDRIYRLLDRRLWPREQTDLYFLLACLNAMMGERRQQAWLPGRGRGTRAGRVGVRERHRHRPLMAHLRGELSVFACLPWQVRAEPRP